MRQTCWISIGVLCLFMAVQSRADAQDKSVLFLVGNKDNLAALDPTLKLRLEWQHAASVTVEQASTFDTDALSELALQHDMVLISESLGSGSTLQDGAFKLQDAAVPVISFEAYMWEDAFWSDVPQFAAFGNTGRTDLIERPEEIGLEEAQTEFYITAAGAAHPMGAGFAEGPLTIHNQPYSVNFGTVTEDAVVIATADSGGEFPSHFLYDTGASLIDGSETPAPRIGLYVGQAANPNANIAPQPEFFNDNAWELIDAMFEFTLGPKPKPGDVNLDGNVDEVDFASIRDNFFSQEMTRADVNHDMVVDFADFGLWKVNSGGPGQAAVPEPSASALLLTSLLFFVRSRRRAGLVRPGRDS